MAKAIYTNKFLDAEKTLIGIRSKGLTKSIALQESVSFQAAIKDKEENLHSLVARNTCSCGLVVKDLSLFLLCEHHRNHATLDPEPDPWFRGQVFRPLDIGKSNPIDEVWYDLIRPYIINNYAHEEDPFNIPKTYSYTEKYVNPQKTIDRIYKDCGKVTSSPVAYGRWSQVSIFYVALKDWEENLHSLLEKRVCSCGLRLTPDQDPKEILTSSHRRNHQTLEPEANPKFRGKVGQRITMPLTGPDWRHEVDVLWNELVNHLAKVLLLKR